MCTLKDKTGSLNMWVGVALGFSTVSDCQRPAHFSPRSEDCGGAADGRAQLPWQRKKYGVGSRGGADGGVPMREERTSR